LQSQLAEERRAREELERAAAERERAAAERERALQENMASMLRYLQAQAQALNRPPPPNLVFIPPPLPQEPQHTPVSSHSLSQVYGNATKSESYISHHNCNVVSYAADTIGGVE
jgi:sRNA-binding protein